MAVLLYCESWHILSAVESVGLLIKNLRPTNYFVKSINKKAAGCVIEKQ